MPLGTDLCIMCGALLSDPDDFEPDHPAPFPSRAPEEARDKSSYETNAAEGEPTDAEAEMSSAGAAVDSIAHDGDPELGVAPMLVADPILPSNEKSSKSEPDQSWAITETSRIAQESSSEFIETEILERQSGIITWMTAAVFFFTVVAGILILQNADPVTSLTLFPTLTPIPPPATFTPTTTLIPTDTRQPSSTPTPTQPPTPTETPRPPISHEITSGETLFGLSLFYDVSMESIAQQNGFTVNSPLQIGQELLVPLPTATPPLEPVELEIGGERVVADPTGCDRVEIQSGDSIAAIAARNSINMDLLMRVNRLTEQSILRPGDTMCIPMVIYGGVLPPTPGPSPTPAAPGYSPGPQLLFPPAGSVITAMDEQVILQWIAVKDLADDEWYRVELTSISDIGSAIHSGFTRDNIFRVPPNWRPTDEEEHEMRWRVSIVQVTGRRQDGGFIYTFGGYPSPDGRFFWQGVIPSPTPTVTPTPSVTPES